MLQVFFLPQNEKQLTANSFGISFCALFQCQNLIQHMLCRLCPNFQKCQNTAFSAYQLFQTATRSICSLEEDVPKQAALYFLPETVVFVLQLPAALAFIRYTVFFQRHHTIRFFKIRHIKLGLFLLFDRKQKLCCLLIPVQ